MTARPGEKVFVRPSDAGAECQIHDWPTEGLAKRLVAAMRAAHGHGGINACRDCLERARADARSRVTEQAVRLDVACRMADAYRTAAPRAVCFQCRGSGQVCNVCKLDGARCVCPSSALPTPEPCSACQGGGPPR